MRSYSVCEVLVGDFHRLGHSNSAEAEVDFDRFVRLRAH